MERGRVRERGGVRERERGGKRERGRRKERRRDIRREASSLSRSHEKKILMGLREIIDSYSEVSSAYILPTAAKIASKRQANPIEVTIARADRNP
eukprot:1379490-Amorphochlora_amoeboformis.AAC.1